MDLLLFAGIVFFIGGCISFVVLSRQPYDDDNEDFW